MKYKLIAPRDNNLSVIEQILVNRGIKQENINHYLNVNEQDNLSPLFLKNIKEAAQIILSHLSNDKSKILVCVDSDYDGYSSSALLLNYFWHRWPSSIKKITYLLHDKKVHGIEIDKIPEGTTLIIVPDASSNEYEIHQQLQEKGIDIVILDHHQAEKESQYACVVNNQLCDYPTKSLCGCAIVYKLCQYFDQMLNEPNFSNQFIDIVATALVGDMMDLRDFETRYLVNLGLQNFRNPFIKGMAEKNAYSIGNTVTPHGVAFYIVPLVNAITRVGTMEEKTILFESMLEYKAYEQIPSTKRGHKGEMETILEQSLRTCTNVKNRQTRDQDAAVDQVKSIIKRDNLLENKVLLIKLEAPMFDKGITGLIANKLMAEYKRPTMLLIKTNYEGQLAWAGSMRACGINDFRTFCANSGLVYLAQGHESAAGFGILDKNIDDFVNLCNSTFDNSDFSPGYEVDFIYKVSDIKSNDILDIGEMKYLWGQNINEPLIAVENIIITKDMIQLMSRDKNPTLKISLPNGVSCIKFKSSENEYENLYSESGCTMINLVGKYEVNRYLGTVTPQLIIEDYEIIDKKQFYF